MGLIKAGMGALGGTLADQWKEFFYCDSLDKDVLMVKGQKRTSGRSSNTKGNDNIISNGSGIAVADGQCMLIVEQGKIVEFCAESGEFTYDTSTEPSIFSGNLGDSVKKTFQVIGKRFAYGGDTGKDQRVYYINTKEMGEILYGTATPVPFRVIVNEELGYKLSVDIRCNGNFTYRICDPLLFYTNVCGNVEQDYESSEIAGRLKGELMTALQPALSTLSAKKVQYYEIPAHTMEISDALNEVLSGSWRQKRGIEVFSVNINSLSIPDDQRKKLTEWEENAMTTNPNTAAARLVGGQIDSMKAAASNSGGSDTCRCSGRCNEISSLQHCRCYDRIYGNGHGHECRRRHECAEPLCHGPAAGTGSASAGTGWRGKHLDLFLWSNCERKILSGVRRKEAGTEDAGGRQLDLRKMRHPGYRKVLSGVRSTETGRRLDLFLRNCEQG